MNSKEARRDKLRRRILRHHGKQGPRLTDRVHLAHGFQTQPWHLEEKIISLLSPREWEMIERLGEKQQRRVSIGEQLDVLASRGEVPIWVLETPNWRELLIDFITLDLSCE